MENLPVHSPLGASSAERWMTCPGSTALINDYQAPVTESPDYQRQGTSAHAAAAHCLAESIDAWEVVGLEFEGIEVGQEIADAIQVYIDHVRSKTNPKYKQYIEQRFHSPEIHKSFFGTTDWAHYDPDNGVLHIVDYKHGEGVMVEAKDNPQLMYYALGILALSPSEIQCGVRMTIVQPRGFHSDGPIREFDLDANEIRLWAKNVLVPAMVRAGESSALQHGDHCRFCPAKLVCPELSGMYRAAMLADPKSTVELTESALGLEYQARDAVKMYLKAVEDEVYRRLISGEEVQGCKLVNKKANRVFKDGAEEVFNSKFGAEAYSKPALKTPAEMARLPAPAAEWVKEWAFIPKTGMTVAPLEDPRIAVKAEKLADTFAGVLQNATE